MVALYLNLLTHIPESYIMNCDLDTILQARIEDFGGVWWLVYSSQTPSLWDSCHILTPSLPSSHHIQHPHLGWWWQSSFWTISSNLGDGKYTFLWPTLVFTSNPCLISLQVSQRTIWGLLQKMLWNSLKSASQLNLIGFVSCFLSIHTITCLHGNFLAPLSYDLDHYPWNWNCCSCPEMISMPDSLGPTLLAQQFHTSSCAMTSTIVRTSLQLNRQYNVLKLSLVSPLF